MRERKGGGIDWRSRVLYTVLAERGLSLSFLPCSLSQAVGQQSSFFCDPSRSLGHEQQVALIASKRTQGHSLSPCKFDPVSR